jgi:hypothetical protein
VSVIRAHSLTVRSGGVSFTTVRTYAQEDEHVRWSLFVEGISYLSGGAYRTLDEGLDTMQKIIETQQAEKLLATEKVTKTLACWAAKPEGE